MQMRFAARVGRAGLIRQRPFASRRIAISFRTMSFRTRIGLILLWFTGLAFAFVAVNKNDPYLTKLRGAGNIALVVASLVIVVILLRRGHWRRWSARLLVILWCLPPVLMLGAHLSLELRKRDVLQTDTATARSLGPHFVVGYSSFAEVALLAEKGLIGGIYLTKHNIKGRTAEELRDEIAALQDKRRAAGLPPLLVAADQEGGIVGHLSPPLTKLPALATLAELAPDVRKARAEEFGRTHGRELAALGVNLNLAPVLDLLPKTGRNRLDFHTLIDRRAISADPAVVSEIASAYVHGLEASGVGAVVKHFPGLGRVGSDTHHFRASLDTPLQELEATDWRPFREVLANSKSQLMIGHVTLSAVDPQRPASHSKRVVEGLLRKEWNYQGVVMTDDMVMGAIYLHGVCTAVVEALNAGVDLLLVAYDGQQFYRVFGCALEASRQGTLDVTALRNSEERLRRAFPED